MHGLLTDELCVAIPDRASEDTIAVHKIRLGVSLGGHRSGGLEVRRVC